MFWKRKLDHKLPEEKLRLFVELELASALDARTDKIVFGEPCDDLPRVTLKAAKAADPKWGGELTEETEFNDVIPATKRLPIWWRFDGVWHEMPSLPWHLLHMIVRTLGDLIVVNQARDQQMNYHEALEATVPLKRVRDGTLKVSLKLTLEPNYCYSVTLKKVD